MIELQEFQPDSALTKNALARPLIFVSGTIGEELAIEALRCGAVGYLIKGNLSRLAPAIIRALDEAATLVERRRQEGQIARLTRVLRMLSGINGAVIRIRDRSELFGVPARRDSRRLRYGYRGASEPRHAHGRARRLVGCGR